MRLEQVNPGNWQTFFHLSQQYEAEFARITKKLPDAHGVYAFTDQSASYEAWLAYEDKIPVGMAAVNVGGQRFDMAEFYVVPARRMHGIGDSLAGLLFRHYSGLWQIRQIIGAEYARDFWCRVIAHQTKRPFESTEENDRDWGRVYIQRFSTELDNS